MNYTGEQYHCGKWLVAEGRYCDRPATTHLGRLHRCADHDALKLDETATLPYADEAEED